MKQTHCLSIFLVIAILAIAVPVNGQNSTGNEGCNFFFRGKPKGKCCSFLILEFGLLGMISGSGQPSNKNGTLVTADLGLMFNRSNSSAIGASFHLAFDDIGVRFGFGPRYRKWLGQGEAIDLSLRLLFAGIDDPVKNHYPGIAFSVSYSIYELLSIDAYFDIIRYEEQIYSGSFPYETVKKTRTGLYLGASGRSWAVLALPVVLLILIATSGDVSGPIT